MNAHFALATTDKYILCEDSSGVGARGVDEVGVFYGWGWAGWFVGWMVGWLAGWLAGWMDGWMVGWQWEEKEKERVGGKLVGGES